MTDHESHIADVIGSFYSAFDNRQGRIPSDREIRRLFVPAANVTHLTDDGAKVLALDAFIAPRLRMLTDGSLCDFHEWEIGQSTHVRSNLASRISTYRKQGSLNGVPYAGNGCKLIHLVRVNNEWLISGIAWEESSLS